MKNKYYLADSTQMDKRKSKAEEFYYAILDPEEIPYIVTDEATLYDIFAGNEYDLIQKVKKKYEVNISIKHFKLPFWQLLDFLEKKS